MGGWINVGGWIIGGGVGGAKGMLAPPPLKLLGPPLLLTPMKHLNNKTMDTTHRQIQ